MKRVILISFIFIALIAGAFAEEIVATDSPELETNPNVSAPNVSTKNVINTDKIFTQQVNLSPRLDFLARSFFHIPYSSPIYLNVLVVVLGLWIFVFLMVFKAIIKVSEWQGIKAVITSFLVTSLVGTTGAYINVSNSLFFVTQKTQKAGNWTIVILLGLLGVAIGINYALEYFVSWFNKEKEKGNAYELGRQIGIENKINSLKPRKRYLF